MEGATEGVMDTEGELEELGAGRLAEAVGVAVPDGLGVREELGVRLGVFEGVTERVAPGVTEGEGVDEGVGILVGVGVPDGLGVGRSPRYRRAT